MIDYIYAYLLAGAISACSLFTGALLIKHEMTSPLRTWLYLVLIWPFSVSSCLKYYLFFYGGEEDDDGGK